MNKCIICETHLVYSRSLPGLVQCPNCGLISANMELSYDELRDLYSESYFNGDEYTDYIADINLHKSNFARRIGRLEKLVGSIQYYAVKEIGCAYGFFLDTIKNKVAYCDGIDISSDAIKYARDYLGDNAMVVQGDYLGQTNSIKYDLICMWDTIEHLSRPDDYIAKMSSEIKSGGYICITTGDIASINARFRGRKWRQIHPPTHLFYFSKQTLTMMLNKHGFSIVDVSYPGNELSIRNIIYSVLCLRMKKYKLYEKIKDFHIMNRCIYINLHDYIYIVAQKK